MNEYSNSLCRKCYNDTCKAYHGRCRKYIIYRFFRKLFKLDNKK